MDPTADVGMSNLVQYQGLSRIPVLRIGTAFAAFEARCILQVHTPVSGDHHRAMLGARFQVSPQAGYWNIA